MLVSLIKVPRISKFITISRSFAAPSSNLKILADDSAFEAIKNSPAKKVYYFTASWCPPCRAIAPVFEAISKSKPDITFVKIDVDNLPATAQQHQIQGVPTFIFMAGNKRVAQFSGAVEASLRNYIDALEKH